MYPNVNLARGKTYNTTVTTGAKDLVDNPLAQNEVRAGDRRCA
ncbi:MAG: Ig-like domain-containing protein [Actinomycetota bacterium]|nr:Ig-like domain-containing protein [Actinomycetota bacterium]